MDDSAADHLKSQMRIVPSGRASDKTDDGCRLSVRSNSKLSVSLWPAISPLVRPAILPQNDESRHKADLKPIVVVDSDDEGLGDAEKVVEELPRKKRPAMTGSERAQLFRDRKKIRAEEQKALFNERDNLFSCLRRRCGRRNQYEDANLSLMLRIGTCPSAGGSRAPLSPIISH